MKRTGAALALALALLAGLFYAQARLDPSTAPAANGAAERSPGPRRPSEIEPAAAAQDTVTAQDPSRAPVATDGAGGAAGRPRWSELIQPVDAVTGRAIAEPSVRIAMPGGKQHVVSFNSNVAGWQLAPGALAAVDGPDHVLRSFWMSALDLDCVEPVTVRLRRSAKVQLDLAPGLPIFRTELTPPAQNPHSVVLSADRGQGPSAGDGSHAGQCLAALATRARDQALTGAADGADRDPALGPYLSDLTLDAPPLAFGAAKAWRATDAQGDTSQRRAWATELEPGETVHLRVRPSGDVRVRVGFPDTGIWAEHDPLPLQPKGAAPLPVRVEPLPTGAITGTLAPPVREGTVTIWEVCPSEVLEPDGETVDVGAQRIKIGPDGAFHAQAVRAGTVHVEAEWLDADETSSRVARTVELEPGETEDLGTLRTAAGATLRFETRVLVDGTVRPLRLEGSHYAVRLYPRGAHASTPPEVTRNDLDPFAMRGVPPGAYALYFSGLSLDFIEDEANEIAPGRLLRPVRCLWDDRDPRTERIELDIAGDTAVALTFELEECAEVVLSIPSPDPGSKQKPPALELHGVAWNAATGQVVEAQRGSYVLDLPWPRPHELKFALGRGDWTFGVTLVPDMLNIEDPPACGTFASWATVGALTVDGSTTTAPVEVRLAPASALLDPTPTSLLDAQGNANEMERSAAFRPAAWPDGTALPWTTWDFGQGAHVYGALPGVTYMRAGAEGGASVVAPAAGAAAQAPK